VSEHPGEQFPPAVDPEVEPDYDPQPDEESQPDYDSEPEPESGERLDEESLEDEPRAHAFVPRPGPQPSFKPGPPTIYEGGRPGPFQAARPGPPSQGAPGQGAPYRGAPPGQAAQPAPPYQDDSASRDDSASQGDSAGSGYQGKPEYEGEGAHPLVEETMARLDELRERPVAEHAEVYADLHERLQTALVEADAEDRG
jgi:hypothetical protein